MFDSGVPVIDIGCFLNSDDASACATVAAALHEYGCLVVKDPRVDSQANEKFIDMMERYFGQADGVKDARPELSFQVGVTPSGTEVPRNHCKLAAELAEKGHGPRSECPPTADPKWRFFWRVGPRPLETQFEELNAPAVEPDGFSTEWKPTMDEWGLAMVETAKTVAEMAAVGFGLEDCKALSSLLENGPHLLAPTGSDLSASSKEPRVLGGMGPSTVGTVLAGFHYDLNFLSVHGKSRFPGLRIWRRDGVAVEPRIPEGCLLVQAGKQLEICTGGHVLAGFHEVLVTEKTQEAARVAHEQQKSTWRVSSTCFAHVASDKILKPVGKFANDEPAFKPILAGDMVKEELDAIMLGFKK